VYREDIGHRADLVTLQSWGRNKRTEYWKEVKATCSAYILGHLKECLTSQIETVLSNAGINMPELKVVSDPTDPDQQTLLVQYPSLESSGKDS
jgi:hypothetical protein